MEGWADQLDGPVIGCGAGGVAWASQYRFISLMRNYLNTLLGKSFPVRIKAAGAESGAGELPVRPTMINEGEL